MRRSYPEMVTLNMTVPRGIDGYWRIMLELDEAGPWTMRDVEWRTNVSRGAISPYVRALQLAGVVEIVGEEPTKSGIAPRHLFRLTRRPVEPPRVRRDGTELPESCLETLWRTMKLAKSFTSRELADWASSEERPVALGIVKDYVRLLLAAGVLAVVEPSRSTKPARYKLARNLGARAPKVLATRALFDPNANAILGEAVAREVQS